MLSHIPAFDEALEDEANTDVCCVCNHTTPSAVRLSTSLVKGYSVLSVDTGYI
ncbi:hypothetical protein DPMN_145056 [Dreissena polymorpha]|uniref:Uncharacterized protein n=1 Tax=Dreissena polymorpha TaxID=45954 RepID=A0A9D4J0V3_DREPO|nr:hypothetical protein DPMN_145056 [Dreissena polymorpha]